MQNLYNPFKTVNFGLFQSFLFFFSHILTFILEQLDSSNSGEKSLQNISISPEGARKAQNFLHHKTDLTTLILKKICKTSRLQKLLYPGEIIPHL